MKESTGKNDPKKDPLKKERPVICLKVLLKGDIVFGLSLWGALNDSKESALLLEQCPSIARIRERGERGVVQ